MKLVEGGKKEIDFWSNTNITEAKPFCEIGFDALGKMSAEIHRMCGEKAIWNKELGTVFILKDVNS